MEKSIVEYIKEDSNIISISSSITDSISSNASNIMEGTFSDSGGGYTKKSQKLDYNWEKYGALLLNKLLSGEEIVLGKNIDSGETASKKDYDEESLKKLLHRVEKNEVTTYLDFNNCVSSENENSKERFWFDHINKQCVTGKENEGNKFEKVYVEKFDDVYKKGLMWFVTENPNNGFSSEPHITGVDLVGGRNCKRKLYIDNESAEDNPQVETTKIQSKSKENIGDLIADVVVYLSEKDPLTNSEHINLSLKSGPKVCFLSSGIQNMVNRETCKVQYENGDSRIKEFKEFRAFNNSNADYICKILNISEYCLAQVFNANAGISVSSDDFKAELDRFYGKSNILDTSSKQNRGQYVINCKSPDVSGLERLVMQFIGYGYIIVHKNSAGLRYIDLRKKEYTEELIKGIKDAELKIVIPKPGEKNRVDVYIDLQHITLQFNIRWKSGNHKPYPSHVMCDYIMKEDLGKVYNKTISSSI